MIPWTDRYIGIPKRNLGRTVEGCDCLGLVRIIYREDLGITLPSYDEDYVSAEESAEVNGLIGAERTSGTWVRIEQVRPYDVLVFKRGQLDQHLGLVYDRQLMLHMSSDQSKIEPYRIGGWSQRLEGIYRHVEMVSRAAR